MNKLKVLFLLGLAALLGRAEPTEIFGLDSVDEVPRVKDRVVPEYPFRMRNAGLEGKVVMEFIVDAEGHVIDPVVIRSNNPWFERPVLDAVSKTTFTPGKKAGRPVATRCQNEIGFVMEDGGEELWSVSKPKDPSSLPPALRWDMPPTPIGTVFPVWPFDEAVKETRGKVTITFVIGPDGHVLTAKADETAVPSLARAALAAIDAWVFEPARKKDGTPCGAVLKIEYEFGLRSGDAPTSESAQDILRTLRENADAKFAGGKDIDAPLKPLSRRRPVYPSALREAGRDGEALIEFFIDEQGDAQLPRILSATAPEFGYAAAQAVATWRFTRPVRQGKPVVVRVQIPVKFSLKSHAAAPAAAAAK